MKTIRAKVAQVFRTKNRTELPDVSFKERQQEAIERVQRETKWQQTALPIPYIL